LLINLISEVAEEVESILLLPHIHRLSPQLELLPEALRRIVLQFTLQQVPKYALQFRQDARGKKGRDEGGEGRGE
jgi:hypothetical protein